MPRWTAPAHITSIDLTSGTVAVVDGTVTVPDDATTGDLSGLYANGFEPEADAPAPSAPIVQSAKAIADKTIGE